MDNYARPIEEGINWLFEHPRRHSVELSSPETWLAQKRYLAEHPAVISVLKCRWPDQALGRDRHADRGHPALSKSR